MGWFRQFAIQPMAGWLALGLVGCAPLAPLAPLPTAPRPAPPAASMPAPGASTGQSVAPASPATVAPPAPPLPAALAGPPYSAAVAARFPDPSVNFATPAFQDDRAGFTTDAEMQALLRGLVADGEGAGPPAVKLLALGSSQRGVPIEALLFSRGGEGATGSAVAPVGPGATGSVAAGRPTVLLVAQQHGDEPAGGEALAVIAQELAHGPLQKLLDRINVIVLPRANPDGAQAQQRVTANGIDANRDHLLLRTPEAQAQAQLVREHQPVVVVDAHEYTAVGRFQEKFGGVQRFDALVQYAMTANLPTFITQASEEWFRAPLLASLKQQGLSTEWYYTTSVDPLDKKVSMGGTRPDTGRNVNGLKNAISILVETRGVGLGRWHLKRRVHTHATAIRSVLQSAHARAADLVKLRQFVDNDVALQACRGEVVVEAVPTASEYDLLMLDPVSGADKAVTVAWDSALMLQTLKSRARPCGYWLAADQFEAVTSLRRLGVQVRRVVEAAVARGETYSETSRQEGARADVRGTVADAASVLRVQVQTVPALVDVPVGSFYVSLEQPLANLVVAALEPDTQSSFLSHRIVNDLAAAVRVLARPELKTVAVP